MRSRNAELLVRKPIIQRELALLDAATAAIMLFDGRSVSMADALYAAAYKTNNLDGHNGYNPTKGHIGGPERP